MKIRYFIALLTMCCFSSCIIKEVHKSDIDFNNNTLTLRYIICDINAGSIYDEREKNIKFSDLDSIMSIREKQLDSIIIVYKSLK